MGLADMIVMYRCEFGNPILLPARPPDRGLAGVFPLFFNGMSAFRQGLGGKNANDARNGPPRLEIHIDIVAVSGFRTGRAGGDDLRHSEGYHIRAGV